MAFCCQTAGMANLTIRNAPDDLHGRLKAQAKRNRRSLNQEVIAALEGREESNEERAKRLIAKVNELRSGMTHFLTAEEIDVAIEEGRR